MAGKHISCASRALPSPRASGQGFDGLTERIADYQAEREAWAAAARAEEEAKRLRECSFAPAINRRRVEGKVGGGGGVLWGEARRFCKVRH